MKLQSKMINYQHALLLTPHIANGGQTELLFSAFQRQLNVSRQVSAMNSATGHMRKRQWLFLVKFTRRQFRTLFQYL
jgi:hypothetical protein